MWFQQFNASVGPPDICLIASRILPHCRRTSVEFSPHRKSRTRAKLDASGNSFNFFQFYVGSLDACCPFVPQLIFGTSWMTMRSDSAFVPRLSSKALVIPLISFSFCSAVLPSHISTMTIGTQFTSLFREYAHQKRGHKRKDLRVRFSTTIMCAKY